jgi:hypothetical protein
MLLNFWQDVSTACASSQKREIYLLRKSIKVSCCSLLFAKHNIQIFKKEWQPLRHLCKIAACKEM